MRVLALAILGFALLTPVAGQSAPKSSYIVIRNEGPGPMIARLDGGAGVKVDEAQNQAFQVRMGQHRVAIERRGQPMVSASYDFSMGHAAEMPDAYRFCLKSAGQSINWVPKQHCPNWIKQYGDGD